MTPQELLPIAAKGNLEAQRQIVAFALGMAREGGCDPFFGLYDAVMWARVAASHDEAHDRQVLASCLCFFAQQCIDDGLEQLAATHAAEAIVILDRLADEGLELGADCVNHLAENLPPYVVEIAKQIKEDA